LVTQTKINAKETITLFPFYFYSFAKTKNTGVSEISALILTGNRTHQKEQLFSLPFWRITLRNGLKN
jgi:hypothetical protein